MKDLIKNNNSDELKRENEELKKQLLLMKSLIDLKDKMLKDKVSEIKAKELMLNAKVSENKAQELMLNAKVSENKAKELMLEAKDSIINAKEVEIEFLKRKLKEYQEIISKK